MKAWLSVLVLCGASGATGVGLAGCGGGSQDQGDAAPDVTMHDAHEVGFESSYPEGGEAYGFDAGHDGGNTDTGTGDAPADAADSDAGADGESIDTGPDGRLVDSGPDSSPDAAPPDATTMDAPTTDAPAMDVVFLDAPSDAEVVDGATGICDPMHKGDIIKCNCGVHWVCDGTTWNLEITCTGTCMGPKVCLPPGAPVDLGTVECAVGVTEAGTFLPCCSGGSSAYFCKGTCS